MRFRSGHQSPPSEPGARRLPWNIRRTLPRIPGRRVPGVRVGTSAPGQCPAKPALSCATGRKRPMQPGPDFVTAFKGLPKKATLYTEDTELFCRVP
jgi:hypothetical protein